MFYPYNDMRFSVKDGNPSPIDVQQLNEFGYLRTRALSVTRDDARFLNGTQNNKCMYVPDKQLPSGVSNFGSYVNENMRVQAEEIMSVDALVRRVSF